MVVVVGIPDTNHWNSFGERAVSWQWLCGYSPLLNTNAFSQLGHWNSFGERAVSC